MIVCLSFFSLSATRSHSTPPTHSASPLPLSPYNIPIESVSIFPQLFMAEPNKHIKIITGSGTDHYSISLKDTLVSYLRSINIQVEDLGTSSYYSAAAEVGRRVSQSTPSSSPEVRGLVACGTGAGVSIFANKFPGVFAVTCLTPADAVNARSINNSNVLAVSGKYTSAETAVEIVDAWLNTPFKSPCPASNNKPWPEEMERFLDKSLVEMAEIGKGDLDAANIAIDNELGGLAK